MTHTFEWMLLGPIAHHSISFGERENDKERKKSTGIQLGIEPGTFRLLVGPSYHWTTGPMAEERKQASLYNSHARGLSRLQLFFSLSWSDIRALHFRWLWNEFSWHVRMNKQMSRGCYLQQALMNDVYWLREQEINPREKMPLDMSSAPMPGVQVA